MKFKLDEDLGTRAESLLRQKGHDVATARSEGISGCSDEDLFRQSIAEQRCLITFDLRFQRCRPLSA